MFYLLAGRGNVKPELKPMHALQTFLNRHLAGLLMLITDIRKHSFQYGKNVINSSQPIRPKLPQLIYLASFQVISLPVPFFFDQNRALPPVLSLIHQHHSTVHFCSKFWTRIYICDQCSSLVHQYLYVVFSILDYIRGRHIVLSLVHQYFCSLFSLSLSFLYGIF